MASLINSSMDGMAFKVPIDAMGRKYMVEKTPLISFQERLINQTAEKIFKMGLEMHGREGGICISDGIGFNVSSNETLNEKAAKRMIENVAKVFIANYVLIKNESFYQSVQNPYKFFRVELTYFTAEKTLCFLKYENSVYTFSSL